MALAGFAGVVIAVRGGVQDLSPVANARLWRLIESSLATALFSLLPFALHHLGLSSSAVWGISSALFAVWLPAAFIVLFRRSSVPTSDVPRTSNAVVLVVVGVAVMALMANAFGLGLSREFGPYFAVLLAYLCLAGIVFGRLLFARN